MKRIITCSLSVLLFASLTSCNGQTKSNAATKENKIVGGGCDGCEIMFIGMPAKISAVDTSAGWTEKGQKLQFVFDVDPLLTTAKRKALQNRGGSGILTTVVSGDLLIAKHDIIPGRNIPDYPERKKN